MKCTVCFTPFERDDLSAQIMSCPRCGPWFPVIPADGFAFPLEMQLRENERQRRSKLSHIIRSGRGSGQWYALQLGELNRLDLDGPLPSPAEQLDRLIAWIGARQGIYSQSCELPIGEVSAWIGAPITNDPPDADPLVWLLSQPEAQRLFEIDDLHDGGVSGQLTMDGWRRVEELKRQTVDSRTVFMAMKFGDLELDSVVEEVFRPAVLRAGFDLRKLSDQQPAGLIDDQLRVALRKSRLVIADLTHANLGAYWEAGFAEGLGRPVIYTCRQQEWANQNTHFDTNHLVTIIWKADERQKAADALTATIRATLPSEAKMDG